MTAFITQSNGSSINLDRISHIRPGAHDGTSELEDDVGQRYDVSLPPSVIAKVLAANGVRVIDLGAEERKGPPPLDLKLVGRKAS